MKDFFKKFNFLENFLSQTCELQHKIEEQLKAFYNDSDEQLAQFIGDKNGDITLLLWFGREFERLSRKKKKDIEKKILNKLQDYTRKK